MLIKNKIIFIIACLLNLFSFSLSIHAEEFDISALEIAVDKQNNIVTACDYFKPKGVDFIIWFQHDCFPLKENLDV